MDTKIKNIYHLELLKKKKAKHAANMHINNFTAGL